MRLKQCLLAGFGLIIPVAATGAHEAPDHSHAPADARAVYMNVRAGSGVNVYETVANWCRLPEGQKTLGPTHGGIAIDRQGNVYFSMDGGPHGILVYSPAGKLLRGMAGPFTGIHSLMIREEGGEEFLYAAHLKGAQAVKLRLDGTPVLTMGVPMESGKYQNAGQFKPTAMAVGPDGAIYVADGYGTNWIHKFDQAGKYLISFGGPGTEPGQLKTPHGLALDTRGDKPLLLVCDRENRRLQHFDLDGKFVAVIAQNLRRPCTASFHGKRIAVAELEARVTILDEANAPVAFLGDNPEKKQWANYGVPPEQWQAGLFTAPHGVCFDPDGNLYVMDWNASGRISRWNWLK